MGFAPDPDKVRAAEEAQAEAEAAIRRRLDAHASAAMSPYERKLIGVLEDIRDAIQSPPVGPVLAVCEPGTSRSSLAQIQRALPPGSLITGPNGPIIDVYPLAGGPGTATGLDAVPTDPHIVETAAGPVADPDGYFAKLLDANPDLLGEAIKAAALKLTTALELDTGQAAQLAEVAIESALQWAAERDREDPVTHSSHCSCGSTLEIRGDLDTEDYDAIREFDYAHQDCESVETEERLGD
ncbi:hypothetical protein [Mycobacterium aquaticum]|uniref:Uncharacterized protein n=1 Tax=Mycobacterium aquaticum TaxID=1927124 RepID=A0A1X0A4F6_9MYCO|nr:hypothetical protein [Mycobacterium aquaticum]ORA24940.1 hypothetical protein BST13_33775 [Mycobacterium aquaticum]